MKFPRINLHIGDYLQQTRHLRAAQQGAFLMLIFYYWANGGLPDNDEQLATISCMDMREWKKNKPVLQGLFQPGWRLEWLDADLKDAAAARDRRSKAGKAGNEKRWGADRHAHADRHAFGVASRTDRSAITQGSLPHAASRGSEPEQEETFYEESVTGTGVVLLRRERA